jgi:hypothetical protein
MELPKLNPFQVGSASESQPSSSAGDSSDSMSGESLGLTPPFHEDAPKIIQYEVSTEVKMPVAPSKGIEVVATMNGFYNQSRKKDGDKFFVKSFEELGSWMICIDPVLEKKRQEFLKQKKAKK